MDAELRTAIRNLQRAGGSFSQLELHTCLDDAGLSDLIRHAIIAKMRLAGFQVVKQDKDIDRTTVLSVLPSRIPGQPRLFQEIFQGFALPDSLGDTPILEQLPASLIDYVGEGLKNITKRTARTWREAEPVPPGSRRVPLYVDRNLKRVGLQICVAPTTRGTWPTHLTWWAYLTFVWEEVLEEKLQLKAVQNTAIGTPMRRKMGRKKCTAKKKASKKEA